MKKYVDIYGNEIDVVGPDELYIKRGGVIYRIYKCCWNAEGTEYELRVTPNSTLLSPLSKWATLDDVKNYREPPEQEEVMNKLELHDVLEDPATRYWVREQWYILEEKDPVDALADAELLVEMLKTRVNE
jgi:hypothetical protein